MNSDDLKDELHEKLEMLAAGEAEPAHVADWATEIMASDWEGLANPRIWNALDQLAGADLMTAPGVLLHGPADFAEWLREYDESTG